MKILKEEIEHIENFYQKNPWQGLGISLGVGVGLGFFNLLPVLGGIVLRKSGQALLESFLKNYTEASTPPRASV